MILDGGELLKFLLSDLFKKVKLFSLEFFFDLFPNFFSLEKSLLVILLELFIFIRLLLIELFFIFMSLFLGLLAGVFTSLLKNKKNKFFTLKNLTNKKIQNHLNYL